MSKAKLNIVYSGPAVDAGVMDVNDLAPALLALGKLLEESNYVLNQETATISVNVKSDFKPGSFQVYLEIAQSLIDQAKDLIEPKKAYGAAQILAYLGLSVGIPLSVVKLIKLLKKEKITRITKIDTGTFKIEAPGLYDSVEVSKETVNLYRSMKVRKNLQDMLKPLKTPGILKFLIREGTKDIEEIASPDADYFELPEIPEEEILDNISEGAFNVVGVSFEEGLKWRLFDGENRISATIKDEKFLDALDQGRVSFTKGDVLWVKLRTRQWQTEKGLKKEHEVLEVIKQVKRLGQIPLPFEQDDE